MSDHEGASPADNGGAQTTVPADEGWLRDAKGRAYIAARGRSGRITRQGNETVAEALKRDAQGPRDQRPKARPKRAPKPPPAPTEHSLKELEHALAEGLKAPALPFAAAGEEWAAQHFTNMGPYLARNLVSAAQYNPWLRAKLEAAVMGEDAMVKVITLMGLAGAVFLYAVPPIIYFTSPRFVPDQAREMLGVPERKKKGRESGAGAPPTPPAEAAEPAAAAKGS